LEEYHGQANGQAVVAGIKQEQTDLKNGIYFNQKEYLLK
jgi:hypothetical protein